MTDVPARSDERRPWLFVTLVFALSVPLWLLGGKYRVEILPALPLGAIMVVCPLAAALTLVARNGGRAAVMVHLAKISVPELRALLTEAWRCQAPKGLEPGAKPVRKPAATPKKAAPKRR